jgi:ABC-2 type transport system ATP-binding protein
MTRTRHQGIVNLRPSLTFQRNYVDPVLLAQSLVVDFGVVRAVDGFDLSVAAGRSVALVGRNGAGKSTTMRVLAGVLPATQGRVTVNGVDALGDPAGVRALVGYCPDVGGLIPRATPWEHLQLAARLRGMGDGWQQHAAELLELFDLTGAADRVTAGFSHGMGRRLSVVLATFHGPRLLLLDEPFDGVDPLGVDATLAMISTARSTGAAVLVSTHLLDLAVQACEEAVVLRAGRVVGAAPAADLVGEAGQAKYRDLIT